MGADGNITIFDWKKIKDKFKEDSKLLFNIPTVYVNKMENKEYIHFYNGDNLMIYWEDEEDWYSIKEKEKEKLREIVKWMKENAELAQWEVWT